MTTEPDTHLDAESRIPPRTDLLPLPSTAAEKEADLEPLVQLAFDLTNVAPVNPSIEPPRKRERQYVWWMSFLALTIVAALVALFGTIFIALPFASSDRTFDRSATDRLPLLAGMLFIWSWIVFLGASFGSFINCVAWRLPRGIPITAAGSACPKCGSRLRWHENLPIYGWLALNGQCGSCNEPIPARYVLVELFFAISFATIAYIDVISGGAGIPFRSSSAYGGVLWAALPDPSLSQLCLCVFHLVAIVLLWLWALLSWDHHPVPKRTIFLSLASLVVAASFWCELVPVSVLSTPMPREVGLSSLWDHTATNTHWVQPTLLPLWSLGLATSLAGMATGAAVGWLGSYGQQGAWRRVNLVSAYAPVGAVVGWQGTLSVALVNSVLVWAIRMLPGGRQRQPFVVALPVALLIHLAMWRWTSTLSWWPGAAAHWSVFLLAAVGVIAIHQAASRVRSRNRRDLSPAQDQTLSVAIPEPLRQPLVEPAATTSPFEEPQRVTHGE